MSQVVYHYTDVDTMLKIVADNTIWATCINYLNDTSERSHYLMQIRNRIQSHHLPRESTPLGPPGSFTIFDDFLRWDDDDGIEIKHFVASFSGLPDSLPQWRSYCPRGNGVAIGFRVDCLKDATVKEREGPVPKEPDNTPAPANDPPESVDPNLSDEEKQLYAPIDWSPRVSFRKIDYVDEGPAGDQAPPPEAATVLDNDIAKACADAEKEVAESDPEIGYSESDAFMEIIKANASFKKHKSFENEDEYRLLADAFWWGEESYFRYRAKGSSLYPYVCLTIPRWASGQELKPFIERVVVGPTPNLKLSLAAVTSFLRTQGLDHAEVKKSEIPFRDW